MFWSSGGAWDRLGRLLGHLGGPGVDFCHFKTAEPGVAGPRASKKGPNMASKMGAKMDQNRRQQRRRKKKALEDRLGAVLGRSWVVLGAVLGSFSCSPSSGG